MFVADAAVKYLEALRNSVDGHKERFSVGSLARQLNLPYNSVYRVVYNDQRLGKVVKHHQSSIEGHLLYSVVPNPALNKIVEMKPLPEPLVEAVKVKQTIQPEIISTKNFKALGDLLCQFGEKLRRSALEDAAEIKLKNATMTEVIARLTELNKG